MIEVSREAEQSVIGAILLDGERAMPEALRLSPEDFKVPEYQHVFRACRKLYNEERPIDLITVLEQLGSGYKPLLVQAAEATPSIKTVGSYVEIVKDTSRRMEAWGKALELMELLEGGDEEAQDVAAEICKALSDAETGRVLSSEEGFVEFYASKQNPRTYIGTGFQVLDRYCYIDKGDYIIIGGRPSTGKTAFTLQMMLHISKSYNVVYFSLETSGIKLFDRLVSCMSGVPLSQIKRGDPEMDWARIAECADPMKRRRFHVVEAAGWTVPQVKAMAARLRADVIFIDYLSLLRGEGKSLYERVTNISMELHTLAQQSKLAVIALSQLNREGKGEPDMTSLRESGQIEQDADVILLLHQQDSYEEGAQRRDLIVAKNKEGMTGKIELLFQGDVQRFSQLEWERGG